MKKAYSKPVDKLLSYGECQRSRQWPDYLKLGFTEEHTPELIRMATDENLHDAPTDSPEVWAPVHAWRTLGQLGAEKAVEPLLGIFWMLEDGDEWIEEELPRVMGMIGFRSTPRLNEYMKDRLNGSDTRIMAAWSLKEIGEKFPEKRNECIKILTEQLTRYSKEDEELNGEIVDCLIKLKAVESLGIIKKAYEADCVDYYINGDFEDVEIEFGLKKKRTKERDYVIVLEKRDDSLKDAIQKAEKLLGKKKISKNKPCPCGSGRKYKKCCLGKSG